MIDTTDVHWAKLDSYSIADQLEKEGLSFKSLNIIEHAIPGGAIKVRKKIVAGLAKELRAECLEQDLGDIQRVKYGCYCISLTGGFSVNYEIAPSPVLYIGSGNVYTRMKSHLTGKLFDFSMAMQSIPLTFWFCDLDGNPEGEALQRELEQVLLSKFREEFDKQLPLLNADNAKADSDQSKFKTGWDKPIQRKKGTSTVEWLIRPSDEKKWKGALQ